MNIFLIMEQDLTDTPDIEEVDEEGYSESDESSASESDSSSDSKSDLGSSEEDEQGSPELVAGPSKQNITHRPNGPTESHEEDEIALPDDYDACVLYNRLVLALIYRNYVVLFLPSTQALRARLTFALENLAWKDHRSFEIPILNELKNYLAPFPPQCLP